MRREPSFDRTAKAVPARQHEPALRPAEHPGNGAQILDSGRRLPRRRTAANIEVGDLADHRRVAEKAVEAVGFIDEGAIGAIGLGGEVLHRRQILGSRLGCFRLQEGRFERRRVFAGDDLALLGDANGTLDGADRLGEDRLVARSAAAADRAAATMKEAQPDIVAPEYFDERDLRLVELPARGQETAILVAVGVAQHDLLDAAAAFEQARVFRQAQQLVHHVAAMAQILDRFEERHDIEIESALARPQQTRFFQQHGGLENVGDASGLRNHIVRHRGPPVAAMRLGGRAQNRQLARGLGRIGEKGGS